MSLAYVDGKFEGDAASVAEAEEAANTIAWRLGAQVHDGLLPLLVSAARALELYEHGRRSVQDMLAGRKLVDIAHFHTRFCEAFQTNDPVSAIRAAIWRARRAGTEPTPAFDLIDTLASTLPPEA